MPTTDIPSNWKLLSLRWAGNSFGPSPRGWQSDLEESYVALVTSHYAIGQECFVGRVDRCRSLLGLDQDSDPLRLFPTLAERQELARLVELGRDPPKVAIAHISRRRAEDHAIQRIEKFAAQRDRLLRVVGVGDHDLAGRLVGGDVRGCAVEQEQRPERRVEFIPRCSGNHLLFTRNHRLGTYVWWSPHCTLGAL